MLIYWTNPMSKELEPYWGYRIMPQDKGIKVSLEQKLLFN